MSFKKLIEMCDENIRKEMDDFYYISKDRMNNLLSSFDSQAKAIRDMTEVISEQQKIITQLQKELFKEETTERN